jgi:glycosidase
VNDQKLAVNPRLKQIRAHYKHFRELGIDAVYFSPLFESGTHGYDTFDYFEIDRRLGDVELFKEIVKELHDIGIKVVLDGVFNHTGTQHFALRISKRRARTPASLATGFTSARGSGTTRAGAPRTPSRVPGSPTTAGKDTQCSHGSTWTNRR